MFNISIYTLFTYRDDQEVSLIHIQGKSREPFFTGRIPETTEPCGGVLKYRRSDVAVLCTCFPLLPLRLRFPPPKRAETFCKQNDAILPVTKQAASTS